MVLKGMKFDYDAVAPREAVIRVRVEGARVPAALFDVTRGNLAYVFELCGVRGTVDPPEGIPCADLRGAASHPVLWASSPEGKPTGTTHIAKGYSCYKLTYA